jgi:hypothetical protein
MNERCQNELLKKSHLAKKSQDKIHQEKEEERKGREREGREREEAINSKVWLYSNDGKNYKGPVSDVDIQSLYEKQDINDQTLFWKEGLSDWILPGTLIADKSHKNDSSDLQEGVKRPSTGGMVVLKDELSLDDLGLMDKYGIAKNNEKYIYKGFNYKLLQDAVAYAKKDLERKTSEGVDSSIKSSELTKWTKWLLLARSRFQL